MLRPVSSCGRFRAAFLLFSLLALAPRVDAQTVSPPVIAAGREGEIRGLIQPYADGELAPGWRVQGIEIDPTDIRYVATGPNGARATLELDNVARAKAGDETTASFLVRRTGSGPAATAALDLLVRAVRANDKGAFWPKAGLVSDDRPPPVMNSAATLVERATASEDQAQTSGAPRGPGLLVTLTSIFTDGVFILLAALVFLLLHLRRVLREVPRWVPWALAGITVVAFLLRVTISKEAILNVWPYERIVPLAGAIFRGFFVQRWSAHGHEVFLSDVIFRTDLVIASLTPLVLFAHARYILRDWRAGLVAALALACFPDHIRFARADSEFIQSLAASSLTFVTLYTALRETDRRWRIACTVLLPLMCLATYWTRPENLVFFPIDLGGILLTSGKEAPVRRKVLAGALVVGAATFAFVVHLMGSYAENVKEGLSFRTLHNAWGIFTNLQLNTLVNPHITPPALTLLALAGAILTWRRGDRLKVVFLVGWLASFFVVHSYVWPSEPLMQARYHLHLTTPLILLAASTTPELLRAPKLVAGALALYVAACPLIYLSFERDTSFNEMLEFDFIRAQRSRIPEGCTVLEFSPAIDLGDADHVFASRFRRVGTEVHDGAFEWRWNDVNPGHLSPHAVGPEAAEALTDETKQLLAHPPKCLMFYEGLSCVSHRPADVAEAPVCRELRERLDLQPIASTEFPARVYDEINAGRMATLPDGSTKVLQVLKRGDPVKLTLYRATPRATPPATIDASAPGAKP